MVKSHAGLQGMCSFCGSLGMIEVLLDDAQEAYLACRKCQKKLAPDLPPSKKNKTPDIYQ